MRVVLLGGSDLRQEYFQKACQEQGIELFFYEWSDPMAESCLEKGDIVKIDPFSDYGSCLKELKERVAVYEDRLKELEKIEQISFLNSPADILRTLNKRYCKEILGKAGLSATPMLPFEGTSLRELEEFLRSQRIFQVFIKPEIGSGAAGVVALKYHPRSERFLVQTSAAKDREYVNTKRLRTLTGREEIAELLEFLFSLGCVVEQWIPKADVAGIGYDLRVVYQFGHIAYIQGRGAKQSAITNLHLNNLPISVEAIALSTEDIAAIEGLCRDAMVHFPGLNSVGFDILLEKISGKPYIIEMNAQGDLMHRDIRAENRIYREQAERMGRSWDKE